MVKGRARRPVRWHAAVGAALAVAATLVGCTGTASTSSATITTTQTSTGFSPVSVSFVSAETGWVLGVVPAGSGSKLAVERTTDGGARWSRSPVPVIPFSGSNSTDGPVIAFADPEDGWIAAPAPSGSTSTLWSTHDAGASWQPEAVPGGGRVAALSASDGVVQLVTMKPSVVQIYSAPVARDAWVRSATSLPLGAGPVPSVDLLLQGHNGWLLENDRTVVAGARLASGSWVTWTPPCRKANGLGLLGASSATDLVAVCDEGVWGPPAPGTTAAAWLFTSDDGGRQFHAVGRILTPHIRGFDSVGSVAMPPSKPQVVVVGGSVVAATFDGGHAWRTVSGAPVGQVGDVGFITAGEGVAIASGGTRTSTLLMTRDGGATWSPVTLPPGASS